VGEEEGEGRGDGVGRVRGGEEERQRAQRQQFPACRPVGALLKGVFRVCSGFARGSEFAQGFRPAREGDGQGLPRVWKWGRGAAASGAPAVPRPSASRAVLGGGGGQGSGFTVEGSKG